MESLTQFTDAEVCETPQDLLNSKPLARFLTAYNKMMRRRVEGWEDVTSEQLDSDYNLAKKVADDAMGMKLPGGITFGTAGRVKHLVDQHLDDVKGRDLDRVLSEDEVRERLNEIVAFDALMRKCERYYLNLEYDDALRRSGVLGADENYSLPIPKITEREMRFLETTGSVNEFFIDDARLTDAQTLSDFIYNGRPLPKRYKEFERALPLDRQSLKEIAERSVDLDETEIQKLFAEVREKSVPKDPNVRLLAYYKPRNVRHSFMNMRSNRRLSDVTEFALDNGIEPISLGTYLRLQLFLAINDKEVAKDFNVIISSGHSDIDRVIGRIVLNNVLPSGNVYCVNDLSFGKNRMLIQVSPGERQFYQTCMEGFLTQ